MKQSIRQVGLQNISRLLQSDYPTLHLQEKGGEWFILGPFPVVLNERVIDRFLLDVHIPRDFPKSVPLVREVGGRIPKEPDRHLNHEGYLCLFLLDERWKYWPLGSNILALLRGPVNDFFLSQLYFEQTGEWPFGQRGHGRHGVLEYYSEELGITDEAIIRRCLMYLSKEQPKGHWPCFCGGGNKMRHCHFEKMTDLHNKVDPKTARYSLSILSGSPA